MTNRIVYLIDRLAEVDGGPRDEGFGHRIDDDEGAAVPLIVDAIEVGRIALKDMMPSRKEDE
jgi:hypothetical protein